MKRCWKCQEIKSDKAYVGRRDVCRLCWYYLSKQEKRIHMVNTEAMDRRAEKLRCKSISSSSVECQNSQEA